METKNWKYKQNSFLWNARMDSKNGRSCSDPLFSIKLLIEKIRQFNLETHFLIMWKLLTQLKDKPFEILQSKNIPNY
jgi:hypothetical protein